MTDLGIGALRAAYDAGERSPVELVRGLLATAPMSTGFAQLDPAGALAAAADAEAALAAGGAGPLTGIPCAVKDLMDTAGVRTSYGSPMFRDHVPDTDAAVVAQLRSARAVMLGKARTHEFAWGITSEPTGEGPCRNPHDHARVAGGSSGGSAVVVAEGRCSFALGSDTAGSVRIPAAFCGVVGFKPTFGTMPVAGVFGLAPSFDHVGVLARTAADAGLVALGRPVAPALHGLRVGVLHHPFEPALDAGVADAVAGVHARIAGLGGELVDLPLAIEDDPAWAFGVCQGAEALAIHTERGLWPARADEYWPDIRDRLAAAAERDPARVAEGRAGVARIRAALDAALATVDVAVAPVAACVAPRFGETDDIRARVLPFTIPQNLGGVPACAIPAGVSDELPVGVQLCAPRGADERVLAAAAAVGSTPWPS